MTLSAWRELSDTERMRLTVEVAERAGVGPSSEVGQQQDLTQLSYDEQIRLALAASKEEEDRKANKQDAR